MDKPTFEVSVDELSRVLSELGLGLLGCPTSVWEGDNVLGRLQRLDDEKFIELLMMQQIGIRPPNENGNDYTMCLFRALT